MTKSNGTGHAQDRWVMVDHDGQKTLFRLVEVGKELDILHLASELPAPTVVVEIALPALPALDEEPGKKAGSKLVLLNVRTVTGADADAAVVRRVVRQRPKLVQMPDAASRTAPTRATASAERAQGKRST